MNKIISIVGPTGSGKTAKALELAQNVLGRNSFADTSLTQFLGNSDFTGVDLISVDSRQVYKGLEILSGADVPEHFARISDADFEFEYFKHTELDITLHGVSIVELEQEWSVAHFRDFVIAILYKSFENNRLPILVGGTGMYYLQLFNTDSNLYVPPNEKFRSKAQKMTVLELQEWLAKLDPQKLESMNNSDRNNPRRLMRAIEIASGKPELHSNRELPANLKNYSMVLEVALDDLKEKIVKRVAERFDAGAVEEVQNILQICGTNDYQVCSTLGVSDISRFLSGEITQEQCLTDWSLHEFQYAKRQLTWFKKYSIVI